MSGEPAERESSAGLRAKLPSTLVAGATCALALALGTAMAGAEVQGASFGCQGSGAGQGTRRGVAYATPYKEEIR